MIKSIELKEKELKEEFLGLWKYYINKNNGCYKLTFEEIEKLLVRNLEESEATNMLNYLSGFKTGIIYIGNIMRKKNYIKQYEELIDENKRLKEEIITWKERHKYCHIALNNHSDRLLIKIKEINRLKNK